MSRVPLTTSSSTPAGESVIRIASDASSVERQAEWFDAARRGDRAAFARLVQSLQDRIFNAVSRMVAQPADALDVTQETFTKALEKIGECRGESQPYTWLFRIAMNCAISRRRKEHVRRATSIDAETNQGGDDQMSSLRQRLASSAPSPSEVVQKRERAEEVRIALARLEPEERALLVMRDIDDMEYAAMASVLEVPLGTLKSRLFRARVALRGEIEAIDAEPTKRRGV